MIKEDAMKARQTRATVLGCTAMLGLLGGCSFSSGGGDPPPAKIIVMPSGQALTCQDGTSQPCPATRN